jgi:hypothetical protein
MILGVRSTICLAATLSLGCIGPMTLEMPGSDIKNYVVGGSERKIVVDVPFTYAGAAPALCGSNMGVLVTSRRTEISCQPEPATWMGALLADRLESAGFSILDGTRRDLPPRAIRISGSLLEFFVEPFPTTGRPVKLEARIHVRLIVTSGTGLQAERDFFARRENIDLNALRSERGYQQIFQLALHRIVYEMIRDIVRLADRYPDLG